ncbi:MAG: PEP-CTERM sorting domain-containing protein [Kiritimatiellia bacterium]|nr:PEP-CTERM sorting domain-containing protein [Kiritimatiellia bacterium]
MKRMTWLAGVAVSLALATSGWAQSATWTGNAGDGLWTNAANWTTGGPTVNGGNATFSTASLGSQSITFTTNVWAKTTIGSTTPFVDLTFNMGGFTLTHDPAGGAFDVQRYGALTVLNGTILMTNSGALNRQFQIGYHDTFTSSGVTNLLPEDAWSRVVIGSGGVINFQDSTFNVATRYLGELTITNGGTLLTDSRANQGFYIAATVSPDAVSHNRSLGIMTITGAGSSWTNYGAQNANSEFRIANHANATGTLNVVNGGTAMHQAGHVWMGASGDGTVNVESGGSFTVDPVGATRIVYVGVNNGAIGRLNVSGSNSLFQIAATTQTNTEVRIGHNLGAQGIVTVSDGGTVMHRAGSVRVGASGAGTLNIESGGSFTMKPVSPTFVFSVGMNSGAVGQVNVSGSNSLLLIDGGTEDNRTEFRVGHSAGAQGFVTVSNQGLLDIRGTNIHVGSSGTGTLVVASGGQMVTTGMLNNVSFTLANNAGSRGTVTVTGAGSVWTNSRSGAVNAIRLGNAANTIGILNITDGGLVVNEGAGNSTWIGAAAGSYGEMNVLSGGTFKYGLTPTFQAFIIGSGSGTGSEGLLRVSGTGSLVDVSVTNGALYVGYVRGDSARMIVESNAVASVGSSGLVVGMRSTDSIATVQHGGQISVATGTGVITVGTDAAAGTLPGHGVLMVTGATSRVLAGGLNLAQRGSTGNVIVADGGVIEVYRNIGIGQITNETGTGRATMLVTGTNSAVRRTALTAGDLPMADFLSSSHLGVGALAGNAWTTGGLVPSDGSVRTLGQLTVENGGLVEMNHRIFVFSNSTVHVNGGQIRTVGGGANSVLGMETGSVFRATLWLGNANSADALIKADGEVRLWGATLQVELADGYTPQLDDVFMLIDGGTLNSSYNRFSYGGSILEDEATFTVDSTDFQISYFNNDVFLTVIPEPGTLGMIGVGLGLAAMLRRRRR